MKSVTTTERGRLSSNGLTTVKTRTITRLATATARRIAGVVAHGHVAPPLLVEAEGEEDRHLADRHEGDRLGEQGRIALGDSVRVVEEAQLEGAGEGNRHQQGVGHHLQRPAAVDGVIQPVHGAGRV